MTDHKPLLAILGPKAKLLTLATARFQRCAICLTAYNYELPTNKLSNADGLSCLPLEQSDENVQDVATILNLKQIEVLPVDAGRLSKETRKNPKLSKVI